MSSAFRKAPRTGHNSRPACSHNSRSSHQLLRQQSTPLHPCYRLPGPPWSMLSSAQPMAPTHTHHTPIKFKFKFEFKFELASTQPSHTCPEKRTHCYHRWLRTLAWASTKQWLKRLPRRLRLGLCPRHLSHLPSCSPYTGTGTGNRHRYRYRCRYRHRYRTGGHTPTDRNALSRANCSHTSLGCRDSSSSS